MSEKEKEQIIEILKDSGFSEAEIEEFIELYKNRELKEQCKYLDKKRKKLLNKVHEKEKNISCLDYLKNIIESKIKEKEI